MVKHQSLTAKFVDGLEPPNHGEIWISDAEIRGFGVRLWAGKKGGGACYAIRLRDERNRVIRESFSIWSDWFARRKVSELISRGEFDYRLSHFLDEARAWARDRIRHLKGGQRRSDRRHEFYHRASVAAQKLTLAQMAERVFVKLEKSGRNPDYVVQLRKLFWTLTDSIRASLMTEMHVKALAEGIANPNLPVMQSRTLQSFIGQLYSRLGKWYGPGGNIKDKINQRVSALRRKQGVPHPRILKIEPQQFTMFLKLLADEREHWREALALRFYFETGAKMRRVLLARWDQILGDAWYPYSASERELWFMGTEYLSDSAKGVLQLASERLASEGMRSDYIFPRKSAADRPIATVRRYWIRIARQMSWDGLPLSHVVQRHHERNTPSYLHMYSYMFVPLHRNSTDPLAVSKFGKPPAEIRATPAT